MNKKNFFEIRSEQKEYKQKEKTNVESNAKECEQTKQMEIIKIKCAVKNVLHTFTNARRLIVANWTATTNSSQYSRRCWMISGVEGMEYERDSFARLCVFAIFLFFYLLLISH